MAGTFLSFQTMAKSMEEDLRAEFRTNFPRRVATALSRTAVQCRDLMKTKHMPAAFDRPTPYALNACRAVPATETKLSSAVLLREFGKGTPAEYFLGPEIDGGGRRVKRFERALAVQGFIKPGGYVIPGSGAAMDAYGNEKPAEIVRVLSVLRAFGEQGYHANRTKGWSKATRVGQIFVVRVGHNRPGLKPGVYRRLADGKVECLMRFAHRPPQYRVRLPFNELVQADAARIFPIELARAVAEQASKP